MTVSKRSRGKEPGLRREQRRKARDEAEFINIRIESWSNVREWLRDAVLEKHEGFYELAKPRYKTDEAPQDAAGEQGGLMKMRGVKSPNVGDALALTLSRPTEGDNIGVVWILA